MPDFNIYQPPGVFVEESLNPIINAIGLRPGVMALVGPSRGYRLGTETVTFDEEPDSETLAELSVFGIDEDTIEVRALDGTLFVLDTHYEITAEVADTTAVQINRIDYEPEESGAPEDQIAEGETVIVSYQYTDDEYAEAQRFDDFDDVQDFFGPAFDAENGTILSPLSFAARFAFANGAREIVCVSSGAHVVGGAVEPSALESAYGKIATIQDVSIVVPLPVNVLATLSDPANLGVIIEDLETHCENASSDGYFRMGLVGAETTVTESPTALAAVVNSRRVVLAWPNRLQYFNGFTNQTIEIGGYYLASAYAGRLISIQSQVPLTRKRVYGFSGIPSEVLSAMTRSTKDAWSSGGVAVTEPNRQGQLIVRHGVTTATSGGIQTREISLVRARDTLVGLLQETVDGSGLVGSYIDDDTPGRVKGVVAGALELAVSNGTVVSYLDLKARQLAGDPSVIEVKFQYKPSYPLNYIVISFSINTTSGETTLLDQATGV